MAHTCEDCGETFETLSSLRLHECPDDEAAAERERRRRGEERNKRMRKLEREEDTAAKRRASDELTETLDAARAGDHTAVRSPESKERCVRDSDSSA